MRNRTPTVEGIQRVPVWGPQGQGGRRPDGVASSYRGGAAAGEPSGGPEPATAPSPVPTGSAGPAGRAGPAGGVGPTRGVGPIHLAVPGPPPLGATSFAAAGSSPNSGSSPAGPLGPFGPFPAGRVGGAGASVPVGDHQTPGDAVAAAGGVHPEAPVYPDGPDYDDGPLDPPTDPAGKGIFIDLAPTRPGPTSIPRSVDAETGPMAYPAGDELPIFAHLAALEGASAADGRPNPARHRGSHRGPSQGVAVSLGLLALLIIIVAAVTLVGASQGSGQDTATGETETSAVQPATSGPLTSTPIPTFTPPPAVVAPPTHLVTSVAPVRSAPATQSHKTPKATATCHVLSGDPSASERRRYEKKHGIPVCRHHGN